LLIGKYNYRKAGVNSFVLIYIYPVSQISNIFPFQDCLISTGKFTIKQDKSKQAKKSGDQIAPVSAFY